MSSFPNFQIFNQVGNENCLHEGDTTFVNNLEHGTSSPRVEDTILLGATQQESEDLLVPSNQNTPKHVPSSNSKEPLSVVDLPWGLLRRKGGDQEEIELHHRYKDFKRDTYTLGRSSKCDVTVSEVLVSTNHCSIYCDYTQAKLRIFLEDSSVNGTFVNDSLTRLRKNERIELKSGDEIFLMNPRKLTDPKTSHAAFVYINLRERAVAIREIGVAPTATASSSAGCFYGSVQQQGHPNQQHQFQSHYQYHFHEQEQHQHQNQHLLLGPPLRIAGEGLFTDEDDRPNGLGTGTTATIHHEHQHQNQYQHQHQQQGNYQLQQLLPGPNNAFNGGRSVYVTNANHGIGGSSSGNQSVYVQQFALHIEDKYIIGDQIGSGMSGQVYICINKATKEHFAVKMIDTRKCAMNPGIHAGGCYR
jgi:hypothetical protein